MTFKSGDRVQTLEVTMFPGIPDLTTSRIKVGTIVKGGAELQVLWDCSGETLSENAMELELVKGGTNP